MRGLRTRGGRGKGTDELGCAPEGSWKGENSRDALARAMERGGEGTVVVTGSVHTVGSAMKVLGLDPLGG